MSAQRPTSVKEARPSSKPDVPASKAPATKGKAPVQPQPSAIAARGAAFRQVLRDTMSEMRKVNWPDQETTRNLTLLVIALSIVLGILLGGVDFLLLKLLQAF